MEAIITAAGKGSRLKVQTRETSKCLLEVGGITIFERMVDLLLAAGVDKIHVVVGHAADKVAAAVRNRRVDYIFNRYYASTNAVVSMALALPYVAGDFFSLPCDLLFDAAVLDAFLARREGIVMAVDRSRPYDAAASKVQLCGERIVWAGKQILAAATVAEATGMYAYYGEAAARLQSSVLANVRAGRRQMFICEVIGDMIRDNVAPVFAADITGLRWCEVDDECDLLRARGMFGGYPAAGRQTASATAVRGG
jgi:choline kinase